MLRLTIFAFCLGLAAACSKAPDPAVGLVVRTDEGTVVGRVASIDRDRHGNIVAAEIKGLEPADAPLPSEGLLAEEEERLWVRTNSVSAGGRSVHGALR